jgi:hypothetical protein
MNAAITRYTVAHNKKNTVAMDAAMKAMEKLVPEEEDVIEI